MHMNPEFENKSKLKEQPGRAVAREGMTQSYQSHSPSIIHLPQFWVHGDARSRSGTLPIPSIDQGLAMDLISLESGL